MSTTDFAARLRNRQPVLGYWSVIDSPVSTEWLAHIGWDYIALDLQHGLIGYDGMLRGLTAIDSAHGPAGIIRVEANDMTPIGRALDAGAAGVIVPLIDTADDAARAVSATRYPPAGVRGVSVSQRSNRYGTVADYFKIVNDNIAVMVQIESSAGAKAAGEIAAVDGVDGLFIGPSDLAAAFGHLGNAGHPEVQDAMASVYAAAKAAGKAIGTLAPVEADARRYLQMGATFVAVGSDLGVLRMATQALNDKFRGPDAVPIAAQY